MTTEMRAKERLLNAIKGKEIDRVPWSPFLAYYWDFLDEETKHAGMVEYYKKMGADPLLRGTIALHREKWENCEIREKSEGNKRVRIYETPVGTLQEIYTFSSAANSWFLTRYPVQDEEEFKILMYLFEHVRFEDNLKEFEREYRELGDDGLILPVIGTGVKTAFQSLVEHWCGTEGITYALYDYPELVQECLNIMWAKDRETVEIALKSPAEGMIFWEDSSTTNISPAFFETYTLPQINDWADTLHREGRFLVHHACGHLRDLMPLIASSSIDALESISPPPTGNITVEEIRKALPERIALIGGIEPTFFLNEGMEDLLGYVENILRQLKGSRYVLGNSDSCPPGVSYDKFVAVSELVRRLEICGF